MKITYISNSIIPSRTANSIHVMKMCSAFSELGHDVTLLAPDRKGTEEDISDIYKYYNVKANFSVKKLPWYGVKGRAYIYAAAVAKEIKKNNTDLIYGRFLPGCLFSSFYNTRKTAFEAHKPVEYEGTFHKIMLKILCKKKNFKKLVVITHALKNYKSDQYAIEENKIFVAHDGADMPRQEVKSVTLKSDRIKTTNVGYIGHLYPGKGMEIISELVKKCPWINFHIIGGLENDIEHWKQELTNYKNIYFYGFVPHSETEKYIKACDILLAPYQTKVHGYGNGKKNLSRWMSPLKIFEYMSMKKPIISSNLLSIKEVLNEGENSLLCDPNDIDSWVRALKRLEEDKGLRKSISENAYKDFINKYSWQARANSILKSL